MLFHDTAERQPDFGVWQVWEELRRSYQGFEFQHSHGLGVLQVGLSPPPGIIPLLTSSPAEADEIRARFRLLGDRLDTEVNLFKRQQEVDQLTETLRVTQESLRDTRLKTFQLRSQLSDG